MIKLDSINFNQFCQYCKGKLDSDQEKRIESHFECKEEFDSWSQRPITKFEEFEKFFHRIYEFYPNKSQRVFFEDFYKNNQYIMNYHSRGNGKTVFLQIYMIWLALENPQKHYSIIYKTRDQFTANRNMLTCLVSKLSPEELASLNIRFYPIQHPKYHPLDNSRIIQINPGISLLRFVEEKPRCYIERLHLTPRKVYLFYDMEHG
jgi:reverse gyrase